MTSSPTGTSRVGTSVGVSCGVTSSACGVIVSTCGVTVST